MDLLDVSAELSPDPSKNDKVEPGELLEEGWFFGNTLDRKSRMLRCCSDPFPSPKDRQEMLVGKSYEETYASIKKLPRDEELKFSDSSLIRTPSMPSSMAVVEDLIDADENDPRSKSMLKKQGNNLLRAPSLPNFIEREDFEDEESQFSMGKLIRQASLTSRSEVAPPKRTSKGLIRGSSISSIPRDHARRKPGLESMKTEGWQEIRNRYLVNQSKATKSSGDLESEKVLGFKDLGFKFDKMNLNKKVSDTLPGLQERKEEKDEEKKVKRPYLSESWGQQSSPAPVPKWVGKKSAEDMKAQIKFWARAVASNVRQEC